MGSPLTPDSSRQSLASSKTRIDGSPPKKVSLQVPSSSRLDSVEEVAPSFSLADTASNPEYYKELGLVISNLCGLWGSCARSLSARELHLFTQDIIQLSSPDFSVKQKLHV